jgi:hypothetical protein
MLKFNPEDLHFKKLEETELKEENILERYDLQEAIANSWDLFKNEIGFPEAFLVGVEINPHISTQNSIDILSYDPDSSSLIVIELKRNKNKLQLLQALSYAAMVSTWGQEDLISNIQRKYNPEPEELEDLIKGNELNPEIKIVLVSEYYDPEVILTSDWLSSNYSVDISAYSISLHKMKEDLFLEINQEYPLKGLEDVYISRRKVSKSRKTKKDVTWAEVVSKCNYSFAESGIELCRKIKPGDPSRKRFVSLRSNFDGFTWINLSFRQKYILVYLKGFFEGDEEFLKSKFRTPIELNRWRDGYSLRIFDEPQFDDLVKWLRLEDS